MVEICLSKLELVNQIPDFPIIHFLFADFVEKWNEIPEFKMKEISNKKSTKYLAKYLTKKYQTKERFKETFKKESI